jgi:hypothetical protein
MGKENSKPEQTPYIGHGYIRKIGLGPKLDLWEDYLEQDKGVIFLPNGEAHKGRRLEILELVQDPRFKDHIEAFAILSKKGLLLATPELDLEDDEKAISLHGIHHLQKKTFGELRIGRRQYHAFWGRNRNQIEKIVTSLDRRH